MIRNCSSEPEKAIYRILYGFLASILLLSTLLLSPVPLSAHTRDASFQEDIARAGVSVVRLVVSYSVSASTAHTSVTCTGLGVLVANWSSNDKNEQNTWVLTDGSLVNPNALTCAASSSIGATLTSIKVLLSTAYNSTQPLSFSGNIQKVLCSQTTKCSDGLSLFSFHSDILLPFIQLASDALPSDAGIALSTSSSLFATPAPSTTNLQPYLIPYRLPFNKSSNSIPANGLEAGTPLVNQHGYMTGMYTKQASPSKVVTAADIPPFLNAQNIAENSAHRNPVHDSWNNGITAFAQKQYNEAQSYFTKAFQGSNNQFQSAQTYANLAAERVQAGSSNSSRSTPDNSVQLPFIGFVHFWLLAVGIGGAILLILLLVLLNSLFSREQRHKEKFAVTDRAVEEQRLQDAEVPQQQRMPTMQQHQEVQQMTIWTQQTVPQTISPVAVQIPQQTTNGASGLPVEPVSSAPSPLPSDFPIQSRALADFPTLDMSQSRPRDEQARIDNTVPLPMSSPQQLLQANEPSFEIITNTDPGLKRQHKPNEDSLFAAQGARNVRGILQQVGLHVVADGMGGHANGQVASRLAIQTLIDSVLPRLMHNAEPPDTPTQLVVEGVQYANQAVYKHNMDNHADMGTTVTAAMLIGSTAFVANIGDSRTYLYRPSQGLSKVTRDHSVVASLVDAGIIQPDDIYTHPKRNQIYRSLGEKPIVEIDSFVVPLQPGDKLLLCSDGLWDMVRDPGIEALLKEEVSDPNQIGKDLIKAALDGGGEDNVSIIVINVIEMPRHNLQLGLQPIYIQSNVHMPQLE